MNTVSKAIDASGVDTKRGGDSVGYSLTVKLLPDAPSGTIRDEIRLLTNDAETPSIPLLVTAQVRGDLSASPGIVSMGRVPPKGEARGRFIVRSSKPFAITGVEGSGDGFQVGPVEGGKKAVHIVNVAYRADQGTSRGDLHRSLRIATDLPGEAPVDVAVTLHVDP